MAVIGILVAAAIISGVSALNSDLSSGGPTSTITSKVTSYSTTTRVETSTTVSISNSTAPEGTMAVQIADLTNLPAGVTHIFVEYSDIEVHTNLANSSSWFAVAPKNQVDLVALASNAVTVSISNIPAGIYDAARFTITSATVTFQGKNTTAIVPETSVSVPIQKSGLDLLPNGTSGMLFDIAPSLVPAQSGNTTQFQLLPYAEALVIPATVPVAQYNRTGAVIALDSQPWFRSTQVDLADNVTVLAALVTDNAVLLVLKNTGNASVTINGLSILEPATSSANLETQTIVTTITTVTTITRVVPNSSSSPAAMPRSSLQNSGSLKDGKPLTDAAAAVSSLQGYQTVASFLVLYNGQVVQPSIGVNTQQLGLILAPGENASLTFIGNISTLNSLSSPYAPLQIVPGVQYLLQVQGPFGQSKNINVSAISPF